MTVLLDHDIVGVRVHGYSFHKECAPDGPSVPLFAGDWDMQSVCCEECHEFLVDSDDCIDTYQHVDGCDCLDCLQMEEIALSGGLPVVCASCTKVFDALSPCAIVEIEASFCSRSCFDDFVLSRSPNVGYSRQA